MLAYETIFRGGVKYTLVISQKLLHNEAYINL